MQTTQLQSTPGFVIYDVADAENYVGPARLGAKLIPSNATMLARHLTYVFATLGMRRSGATIGLKSDPADAAAAVDALATELAEEFSSQRLLTTPGLRLDSAMLAPVLAHDQRNPIANDGRNAISFGDELIGVGAATAAAAAIGSGSGSLSNKSVAIEGFGAQGLAIAREVLALGGSIVAISTAKSCVTGNFDGAALTAALTATIEYPSEDAAKIVSTLVESHGGSAGKPWQIWGSDNVDVIFCGSKPGALSGEGATTVAEKGTAVVAWSAAAISSKALAELRKAGVIAVADFVSAVGPALSWWANSDTTHDQLREQTSTKVSQVMAETADHDDGYYMAACYRAEQFMSTWLDELPFGRPLG